MTATPQPTPHFTVSDELQTSIDHVTPELLRPFLLERDDGRSGAVLLRTVDVVLQGRRLTGQVLATAEGAGGWVVRVDDDDHQLAGRAPNTDAVFDLLRSWAAGDGWWLDAFSWQQD